MDPQPASPSSVTAPSTNPMPPSTATVDTEPRVPQAWPGAFGIFKYSKRAVSLVIWPLIILFFLNIAINFGISLLFGHKLLALSEIITFIIDSLVSVSYTLCLLAGVRGQRLPASPPIRESIPFVLKMIGLTILIFLSLTISLLLLIIPFFFVAPRLSLANYFLIDKKMGVLEAYKASWASTKGHAGKVWGIAGVYILMIIPAFTIIGIPVTIYLGIFYSAVFAVLYEYLNNTTGGGAVNPPAPAAVSPAPSAPPNTPAPSV